MAERIEEAEVDAAAAQTIGDTTSAGFDADRLGSMRQEESRLEKLDWEAEKLHETIFDRFWKVSQECLASPRINDPQLSADKKRVSVVLHRAARRYERRHRAYIAHIAYIAQYGLKRRRFTSAH